VERAAPGTRVAVNLAGITRAQIARGQMLCRPGWLEETRLVDARFQVLASHRWQIKHNMPVEFFLGTARTPGRVRLLGSDALEPGTSGWVQLRLRDAVPVQRGDRFVVRMLSPSVTLGGGQVVDARPRRRHRRNDARLLERLATLETGDPEAVMLHEAARAAVVSSNEAIRGSGLAPAVAAEALAGLARQGWVRVLSGDAEALAAGAEAVISAAERWKVLLARMRQALTAFHETNPLRAGMSLEELRTRCHVPPEFWEAVVAGAAQEGVVTAIGSVVALAGYQVGLTEEQQRAVDEAMAAMRAQPFGPPSVAELGELLGPGLLEHLVATGRLVKVSPTVIFDAAVYKEDEHRVVAYLDAHGQVTLGDVRDLLGTSRKYAQALLEYLDRKRVTKRLGDVRVLRR